MACLPFNSFRYRWTLRRGEKRGQPSVASISKEERKTPAAWYDARFFYELAQAMSKVVFLDQERTMPETRSEFWKLMKHLNAGK